MGLSSKLKTDSENQGFPLFFNSKTQAVWPWMESWNTEVHLAATPSTRQAVIEKNGVEEGLSPSQNQKPQDDQCSFFLDLWRCYEILWVEHGWTKLAFESFLTLSTSVTSRNCYTSCATCVRLKIGFCYQHSHLRGISSGSIGYRPASSCLHCRTQEYSRSLRPRKIRKHNAILADFVDLYDDILMICSLLKQTCHLRRADYKNECLVSCLVLYLLFIYKYIYINRFWVLCILYKCKMKCLMHLEIFRRSSLERCGFIPAAWKHLVSCLNCRPAMGRVQYFRGV